MSCLSYLLSYLPCRTPQLPRNRSVLFVCPICRPIHLVGPLDDAVIVLALRLLEGCPAVLVLHAVLVRKGLGRQLLLLDI